MSTNIRTCTIVLTSGVAMSFRNLKGRDQEKLTNAKSLRDGSGFAEMLADATLSLGNNTNVTVNDIERMLSNDRKDAMIALRQHSLRYQKLFNFAYEWPLQGTQKDVQQYSVEFNERDFPRVPYKWVRERMDEMRKEAETAGETFDETKFPIMFENYSDMLKTHFVQETTMPESNEIVRWQLLTGEQENKFSNINRDAVNANTMLAMRVPRLVLKPSDKKAKEVLTAWNHGDADVLDVEHFRKAIRDVEGTVNSTLMIQNQKDTGRTARVDLLGTTDFFFPSQAI